MRATGARRQRRSPKRYAESSASSWGSPEASRSRVSSSAQSESFSWSDPETTFDRLLKGKVYQKVVTRPCAVNDSSSAESEHAPSIRLFESPSAVAVVPPPRPARKPGKENRPTTRAGPQLAAGRLPAGPSSSTPLPSSLAAGAGPSSSTPLPGRLQSVAPASLSPVPAGVSGWSPRDPGASPGLRGSTQLSQKSLPLDPNLQLSQKSPLVDLSLHLPQESPPVDHSLQLPQENPPVDPSLHLPQKGSSVDPSLHLPLESPTDRSHRRPQKRPATDHSHHLSQESPATYHSHPMSQESPAADHSHLMSQESPATAHSHPMFQESPATNHSHYMSQESPAADRSHQLSQKSSAMDHSHLMSQKSPATGDSHHVSQESPASDRSHHVSQESPVDYSHHLLQDSLATDHSLQLLLGELSCSAARCAPVTRCSEVPETEPVSAAPLGGEVDGRRAGAAEGGASAGPPPGAAPDDRRRSGDGPTSARLRECVVLLHRYQPDSVTQEEGVRHAPESAQSAGGGAVPATDGCSDAGPAADAAAGLPAVLLALRAGKGWRRSLCQVAPPAGPSGRPLPARDGRRSLQPVRERPEQTAGGPAGARSPQGRRRSLRTSSFAERDPGASGPGQARRFGRLSMQYFPGRAEEDSETAGRFRPRAGGRPLMQAFAEVPEEESSEDLGVLSSLEDLSLQPAAVEGDAGHSENLRCLRSGKVRLSPEPERPESRPDCSEDWGRVGAPRDAADAATGGAGRRSSQWAGRRSVLPPGLSPAPRYRRSSVCVSPETPQRGADVSLRCELPEERVLDICGQQQPVGFVPFCRRAKITRKIGEGVYGEVFLCEKAAARSVMKIMPIEGDFEVNDAAQKTYGEVLSELLISKSLSDLQDGPACSTEGFVRLLSCHVVRGAYPTRLRQLWETFDRDKGSENEHPRLFPGGQLFLALEYSHAGEDLEHFQFRDVDQAIASFMQIAFSLAVAETALEFEHRDLHWGNVLVQPAAEPSVPGRLRGRQYLLPTAGLRATLIDFTLSRLRLDGAVVYNNLAEDPALFTAQGDHQFEVYRQMREATGDVWRRHCPATNVQWLFYLADKLCSACAYADAGSRRHRMELRQLVQLRDRVSGFSSASELVEDCCRHLTQ